MDCGWSRHPVEFPRQEDTGPSLPHEEFLLRRPVEMSRRPTRLSIGSFVVPLAKVESQEKGYDETTAKLDEHSIVRWLLEIEYRIGCARTNDPRVKSLVVHRFSLS